MRLLLHVARLVAETVRYGVAVRRYSLVAMVVAGLLVIALTAAAQTAVPVVLYPFA